MRPRLWHLLSLALVCSLLAAKAANIHEQSPSRFPDRSPVAGLCPCEEVSPVVTADEAEQDSWDIHPAAICFNSTTDLCRADFSSISGKSCARSGAPSLVNQGVRLQI
jgi:hypothetical protein